MPLSTPSITVDGTIAGYSIAKLDASGGLIQSPIADTSPLGIYNLPSGISSGSTPVVVMGQATCTADAPVSKGDFVGPSNRTAGDCGDFGIAASDPPLGVTILGVATTSAASGGSTFTVQLFGPGHITSTGTCDIRAWGAIGNVLGNDDSAGFSNGLAAGCRDFVAPPLTPTTPTIYYFDHSVSGALRVDCLNRDLVTIKDGGSLGASQLFFPQGNSTTHLAFFEVKNCTLQNGSNASSPTSGMDAIRADYVDNIVISNNIFKSCQGYYCIADQHASHIDIRDNIFVAWTFAAHSDLVETVDIHVRRNQFLGGPSCSTGVDCVNPYADANGSETPTTPLAQFFTQQKWVEDNIVWNNQRWECFDSHGGEELTWKNNYCINGAVGISVGPAAGFVSAPVCKNIDIENNTLIQGSGYASYHNPPPMGTLVSVANNGIVVNGLALDATACEHVRVAHNTTNGFGAQPNGIAGTSAYQFYNVRDLVLEGNASENAAQTCLQLYYNVVDAKVTNFRCQDMNVSGSLTPTQSIAFLLGNFGIWGYKFDNLVLTAGSTSSTPHWMFYNSPTNYTSGQVGQYETNLNPPGGLFAGAGFWPVNQSAIPTSGSIQKFGDVLYDTNGIARFTVSGPAYGYGSADITTSPITVSGTDGSSVVVVQSNNSPYNARALAPGARIKVGSTPYTVIANPATTAQAAAISQVAATTTVATYTAANSFQVGNLVDVSHLTGAALPLNQIGTVASATATYFTINGTYTALGTTLATGLAGVPITLDGSVSNTLVNASVTYQAASYQDNLLASGGPTFTVAGSGGGCGTLGSVTGAANAGTFVTTGTTGACTVQITFPAASNGWICSATDQTHAYVFTQSGGSSTTCVLTGVVTTLDKIGFSAVAY